MTKWHMTCHVSDRLSVPPPVSLTSTHLQLSRLRNEQEDNCWTRRDRWSRIWNMCIVQMQKLNKQREEARNLCIISNSICIIISLGNCRSQHPRYSRLYVTCILRHQIFVLGILWDPLSGLTPQDFLWKVVVIKFKADGICILNTAHNKTFKI